MAYVINVARKATGSMPPRHIFRTADDSIYTKEDGVKIAQQLTIAYPRSHYEISLSRVETIGQYIDWESESV